MEPPTQGLSLDFEVQVLTHPRFQQPLQASVRDGKLAANRPWIKPLVRLPMEVTTVGWKFPLPATEAAATAPRIYEPSEPAAQPESEPEPEDLYGPPKPKRKSTRIKPPGDCLVFKDRLLYLLQPPLENLFEGKQVRLPFQPFPYQLEGIAFLMPRHSALLADEMGLGKTAQTIIALRLLYHAGLVTRGLLICPKPLVNNWSRELRSWAEDLPFEIIGGDTQSRRASWLVSNCPLKVVNYELLTRDVDILADERCQFDVVVLDEAQRIKNKGSKTADAVCSIKRSRSWALTGTPIENKPEDLVNIFTFVDPERIPPDTPPKLLGSLTSDCILRRVKEQVMTDMPPKIIRDAVLDLSPAQRAAYDMAEKEGVIHLNAMGDTITVQHVFELIMRLKQICNFDPLTGQSSKLEQLVADMQEVAESGRKAIVFSQWVEPLETIARALEPYGPLQFHGKIPPGSRQAVLDRFKSDPSKHVILMSYATGSVGLNLQFTNYVFLFDRWWNPAIEDQAINRAHRIGQKSQVVVTRFVSQDTIETRIADVLDQKRQLFAELIEQNGPPASMGLSENEIFGLFDIQVRPKRSAA